MTLLFPNHFLSSITLFHHHLTLKISYHLMLLSYHLMVQHKTIKTWCTANSAQFTVTHIALYTSRIISNTSYTFISFHNALLTSNSINFNKHTERHYYFTKFLFFFDPFTRNQSFPSTHCDVMERLLPRPQSHNISLGGIRLYPRG